MKKLLSTMVMLFVCMTAFGQQLQMYMPKHMQSGEYIEMTQSFDMYHMYQDTDGNWQLGTKTRCTMTISNYANLRVKEFITKDGYWRKPGPGDYVLLGDMDNDVLIMTYTWTNDYYWIDITM